MPKIKNDKVNHPKHYTSHPSGIECIEVTEHMMFNIGNAVKYIWRAGEKGSPIEDLEKAAWYLKREIKRLEKQNGKKTNKRRDAATDKQPTASDAPIQGVLPT